MASSACCSLPPVEVDYTPKGSFSDFAGVKSYITGSSDSKQAIVILYDIFGYPAQTLQGADLLASQGFKVLIPDVLNGNFAQGAWFHGSGDAEAEKNKGEYMSNLVKFSQDAAAPLRNVCAELRSNGVQKIGTLGMCWGAAVAINDQTVDAFGMVHPSLVKGADAARVKVPVCMLPSKDEDAAEMAKFDEGIKANPLIADKSVFKTFTNAVHGFAAARADLKEGQAKADYVEAYTVLTKFYKNAFA